eukprot:m.178738 g.178738  ORF g.178738 m.178738 type:complete len:645 (-) comp14640_c1_seq9:2056-3990(-)
MALDALLFDDPLELPVEPRDGFCNAHNIMEASGHLDQLLAGVGLDSIDLHTVCSTPKTAQHTINVVHALFRLYDDTLNHRVERESRMARLSDELRHAEEQNESLKDDKRTLERDVSQRDEAIRQLKKAEDAMAKDLKETKQQAKLARTNARQLAKQYSVEKRKMELQIIGLKDRLAKKLKPSSVTSALDEFHTINRSSGARGKWAKPKPSEAADAALQFAAQQGREEKIRELEEENLKMRTTLADLEGELAKVVHLRSDIGSGIPATNFEESFDASQKIPAGHFELPFEVSRERIERSLQRKLQILRSQFQASLDQPSGESQQDVAQLKDEIQHLQEVILEQQRALLETEQASSAPRQPALDISKSFLFSPARATRQASSFASPHLTSKRLVEDLANDLAQERAEFERRKKEWEREHLLQQISLDTSLSWMNAADSPATSSTTGLSRHEARVNSVRTEPESRPAISTPLRGSSSYTYSSPLRHLKRTASTSAVSPVAATPEHSSGRIQDTSPQSHGTSRHVPLSPVGATVSPMRSFQSMARSIDEENVLPSFSQVSEVDIGQSHTPGRRSAPPATVTTPSPNTSDDTLGQLSQSRAGSARKQWAHSTRPTSLSTMGGISLSLDDSARLASVEEDVFSSMHGEAE